MLVVWPEGSHAVDVGYDVSGYRQGRPNTLPLAERDRAESVSGQRNFVFRSTQLGYANLGARYVNL
jgi:hypothetical protein